MSMPGAAVRPGAHTDEPAVFDLASDMATTFTVDRAAFRGIFHRVVDDDGALLLVVDVDGRVGGYALGFVHPAFFANGPIAWVEEIAVRPDLRRRGLGAMLMAGFEQRCDARLVALATRRAADFYGALGYEPSATYFRKLL